MAKRSISGRGLLLLIFDCSPTVSLYNSVPLLTLGVMRSLFTGVSAKRYLIAGVCILFVGLGIVKSQYERDDSSPSVTRATSESMPHGVSQDRYGANTIKGEALDEAMAGRTLYGTPVARRTAECFPA